MFILDYFPSPTRILHEIISSQMIQEQLQLNQQNQPHLNHLDQNHQYQGAMIPPAGGMPGGGGILKATTPMTSSSEFLLQPNSSTNHMVVNSITPKSHHVGSQHHKSVTTTAPSGGGGGTGHKIAPPRPPRARQKASYSVTNFDYFVHSEIRPDQ